MTIQEAIKSGRPFRRPFFETFIVCPGDKDAGLKWADVPKSDLCQGKFWPREEDLLATDWETQPIPLRHVWVKSEDLKKLFAPGAAYYGQGVTIFRDPRREYQEFVECPKGGTVVTPEWFNSITAKIREDGSIAARVLDEIYDEIFTKAKQ